MTSFKQHRFLSRDTIVFSLFAILALLTNLPARAQGERLVQERMSDLFSTKSIDINVLDERPASLSTEKEFSDEVYPEDDMEPVEPDELQFLTQSEIQECAVRFPGTVQVKTVTDPRATIELNRDEVLAIKINARSKGVRIEVVENQRAINASAFDKMGSYVRGVCVFSAKADTRVNLSLSKVVVDQLALFENGFKTVTSVHVEERSKLVSVAQDNSNPRSMMTIMGDGLYECPSVRKERFRCSKG